MRRALQRDVVVRPAALALSLLALGCGPRARTGAPVGHAENGPTQLLSYFGPGNHVMARVDVARMRESAAADAWADVLRMPSVYRTVLGRMQIEPLTELDSILITGSGVLVDDSTMLLRLVPTGGVLRERMLHTENQQLNWAESDGFVTARWPSDSGCLRRAIFVAPHEVVLSPVASLERALEVAHTHRARAPDGELVEPYLDFAEGELGRIWTDDMPSRVMIAGMHPVGGDLLVRELGLDATEIRLELRWYDATEAERAEAELERLFGLGSSTALLSGVAHLLSLFGVTRSGTVTVASGTLTDAELVDALGMARAAAALFL